VSTRIGIIAEGPIDHCLLPPLLGRIARERADYGWPVTSDDVAEIFSIRKRGHGGVLETVRRLVKVLDAIHDQRDFCVILFDLPPQVGNRLLAFLDFGLKPHGL
jgi:hypothetical protein